MRTRFVILFLLIEIAGPAQGQVDQEAIKAVVARETSAYMTVDYKAWADTWNQVPYAFWAYSDSETSRVLQSWAEMDKAFASYFKTSRPSLAEITNEWIELRVYDTGAYVRFTQKVRDDFDVQVTTQIRVLEKVNGQWKIVCVKAALVGN